MKTLTFKVPQMSCAHCVSKITSFVQEVEGVQSVECNLPTQEVEVAFSSPASLEQIKEAIEECGFEVE